MTASAEPATSDLTFDLPVALIRPAKDNVRGRTGDVDELAASIAAVGVLEPIVVTAVNGSKATQTHYQVVLGHRRLAAAKKAKLSHVPAIVREFTDEQRVEAMLIENLQREDLTPLEEAAAYRRLVELGLSQRDLGKRIGRSQAHVSKRLALLELPEPAKKALDSGGITLEDAAELGKIKDHPERVADVVKQATRRDAYHRPGEVGRHVAGELDDVRTAEKIAKTRAELEKSGVPIVELRGETWGRKPPEGAKFVVEYAYDSRSQVQVKPANHKSCTGRAVAIDEATGSVYEICTKPELHKDRIPKAQSEREARRKVHDKELREARKARRAFIAELLKRPPVKGTELLTAVVKTLILEAWQEKRKVACELLELDVDAYRKAAEKNVYRDRWALALLDEASNPRRVGAVALAMVLAVDENELGGNWHLWTGHGAHFAFLEEHGYKTSPAEKLELAGKAPSR